MGGIIKANIVIERFREKGEERTLFSNTEVSESKESEKGWVDFCLKTRRTNVRRI